MSKIEAFYTLEVKDKNGKTTSKITKPCKSWVLQFLQIIEAQMFPAFDIAGVKNTAGAGQNLQDHATNLWADAAITDDTKGIVVGTGTTPVASDDYALETQIVEGVGAGQLSHGATSKVTTAEVGANVDFQIIRTFTNTSGNTINVTEIGIYVVCMQVQKFMVLHEIVTLTAVPNNQTLTATITIRTTV